jgi:hypothetical protein
MCKNASIYIQDVGNFLDVSVRHHVYTSFSRYINLHSSGVTRILPVVGLIGARLGNFCSVRCLYLFKTIGIYYLLIGQKALMGGLSSSAFWNSLMGGLIPVTYRQSRAERVKLFFESSPSRVKWSSTSLLLYVSFIENVKNKVFIVWCLAPNFHVGKKLNMALHSRTKIFPSFFNAILLYIKFITQWKYDIKALF